MHHKVIIYESNVLQKEDDIDIGGSADHVAYYSAFWKHTI